MDPLIAEKYEFGRIAKLLDAIQIYTDKSVFSQECPAGSCTYREGREPDLLAKLVEPYQVSNEVVHRVLEEILKNVVEAAKEMLPLEDGKRHEDYIARTNKGIPRKLGGCILEKGEAAADKS